MTSSSPKKKCQSGLFSPHLLLSVWRKESGLLTLFFFRRTKPFQNFQKIRDDDAGMIMGSTSLNTFS